MAEVRQDFPVCVFHSFTLAYLTDDETARFADLLAETAATVICFGSHWRVPSFPALTGWMTKRRSNRPRPATPCSG